MIPTKEEFLHWLDQVPADAYVGSSCRRWGCPLARYLNERYPGYVHAVYHTRVVRYPNLDADDQPLRIEELPEWAQLFVERVDQQLNLWITAKQAKELVP